MNKKGGAREGSFDAKSHKLVCTVTFMQYLLSSLHFERMPMQNTSSYRDTTELIEL